MDEAAKRLADLAAQYAPSVIDSAKAAAQVEAWSCLASSLIAFAIVGALVMASKLCWRLQPSWDDADDWLIPPRIIGCACLVIAVIPASIGVWCWLDPWTWVAMSHPELWIAKQALHL
jgi:hypothetical protein